MLDFNKSKMMFMKVLPKGQMWDCSQGADAFLLKSDVLGKDKKYQPIKFDRGMWLFRQFSAKHSKSLPVKILIAESNMNRRKIAVG